MVLLVTFVCRCELPELDVLLLFDRGMEVMVEVLSSGIGVIMFLVAWNILSVVLLMFSPLVPVHGWVVESLLVATMPTTVRG
jgi:hypothetical protein